MDTTKRVPRGISISTKRALERIGQGETAYRAAKNEGIALATIYRALRRIRDSHGK